MNIYTKTQRGGGVSLSSLRTATLLSVVALTLLYSCPAGDGTSSPLVPSTPIAEEIKDKDPAILYNADMHEDAQSLFSRGDIDNPYLFTFGVTSIYLIEALSAELTITGDTNNDGEVEELYQKNMPLNSFTAGGVALKNTAMLKKRMYVMDNNALVSMQKDTTMNAAPSVYKENDYIVGIGFNGDNDLDYNGLPEDITLRVKILYEKEVLKESTTQVSKADPYKIYTWRDLQHMNDDLDGDYEVQNDIIFPEVGHYGYKNFEPIGQNPRYDVNSYDLFHDKRYFSGTFEGNNHKIEGLYLHHPSKSFIGLFGVVRGNQYAPSWGNAKRRGRIKNITVYHVGITGEGRVGGLIGQVLAGTVLENNHVYALNDGAKVSGSKSYVGGLIGQVYIRGIYYHIKNISAHTDVEGENNVGGLIGDINAVSVVSSYAIGDVTGNNNVGGLIGSTQIYSKTTVSDSISGLPIALIGNVSGYAIGDVTGNNNVGGMVGYAHTGSYLGYFSGDVKGNNNVGGILGTAKWRWYWANLNKQDVTVRAYVKGNIDGKHKVGGLVGYLAPYQNYITHDGQKGKTVIVGYFRGRIENGNTQTTGLVLGNAADQQDRVINSYFSKTQGNVALSTRNKGIHGKDISIATVTDRNYRSVFDNFIFGEQGGQWTWVGDGKWPAINIGDVAPVEEQPIE